MKKRKLQRTLNERLQLLHKYYIHKGFYIFIANALKKALIPFLSIIGVLLVIDWLIIDLKPVFLNLVETLDPMWVFFTFFLSESYFGLIPPEIFMAWAGKSSEPYIYLSILAALSYFAGIHAYAMGLLIHSFPKVRNYIEFKVRNHIKHLKAWGGVLIVAGAVLPIPYAAVSLTAGIIRYSFKLYLLLGLVRIVRYYIYGFAIFGLI
ncbi:MAG: hypothetical protein JEZ03_05010 [Bacteroidales bacterium]|nr:hypothetical protein [Bacteroidales bacterium]